MSTVVIKAMGDKNVAIDRDDPTMPGQVVLSVTGPKGGVQASVWLNEDQQVKVMAALSGPPERVMDRDGDVWECDEGVWECGYLGLTYASLDELAGHHGPLYRPL
jgi:hypothetical protein